MAGDLAKTYQQDSETENAHQQLLRQANPAQNTCTGVGGSSPQRGIRSSLHWLIAWRWRDADARIIQIS
jgi:hypothetical protein